MNLLVLLAWLIALGAVVLIAGAIIGTLQQQVRAAAESVT